MLRMKQSQKDDAYSEANDPIYNQLCQPVHENLLGSNSQSHEERVGGDTIKGILHDIFRSGDDANNYMRGASDTNLQDKYVHLENTVIKGNASAKARLRALRSRGKRSQKHMSMRQHRQCGSFDFPRKYQRYDMFLPMHEMWKEYIGELLRNCRKKGIEQCLLAADFHGAILAVVESKNKSFIGAQGIMVRETTNTFGILTSENKFRGLQRLIHWAMESNRGWFCCIKSSKASQGKLIWCQKKDPCLSSSLTFGELHFMGTS